MKRLIPAIFSLTTACATTHGGRMGAEDYAALDAGNAPTLMDRVEGVEYPGETDECAALTDNFKAQVVDVSFYEDPIAATETRD